MVQIRWTSLAVDDLKGIYEYISKDSSRYAKIQVIRLRARTKILINHPMSGKLVPEHDDSNFRELIEGNFRIIYKIVSNHQIDILTIHHSSRDLKIEEIDQ